MVRTFQYVEITNRLDRYPACLPDVTAYPDLVAAVEDEWASFIIEPDVYDSETGRGVYPSDEFFAMLDWNPGDELRIRQHPQETAPTDPAGAPI